MVNSVRFSIFLTCLFSVEIAFAQGGACPSGANYVNPSNPNGPLVTLSSLGVTSCYFVSKSTGSDTNAGTSESAPWAHLPGMCYATCGPSYTPSAGQGFILKGCDVWTAADLPATWQWSGTSGSPIYIGVDQTWYNTTNCPSGWNRPVWNAQGTALTANNYFLDPSSDGTGPVTVENHDVTFDNIEMTGLEITSSTSGGYTDWFDNNSYDMTISNMYMHGWNATADNCVLMQGPYGGGTSHNILYVDNVVDGSDRTGSSGTTGTCNAFFTSYNGVKILNNVFRYLVNPFSGSSDSTLEIGGNLFDYMLTSLGGANHCNCIESLGGGTWYIHDNVIRNYECGGGESLWVADTSGEIDYVWNNVIYNLGTGQTPQAGENSITGTYVYFWNNTVVPPSGVGAPCLMIASGRTPTDLTVYAQNNHCISTASNAIDPNFANYGTLVASNNLLQTPSIADADASPQFNQYTASQTYAYSPVASTNSTVGAGTNLTSSWPSGFSASDTRYGCNEQTVGGVVQAVCPARTTALARPASAAWDIGAYEYGPAGPTNLTLQVTPVGQ
jgi:hypothetical protein